MKADKKPASKKFTGLTGEQAALLLSADEKNLAQKVTDRRTLSASDRKRLAEIVARDTKETAPEGWCLRATQLARALGLHRNTVNQHINDPTHPKRTDGLGWNVSECRRWYQMNGTLKAGGAGGEVMTDALLRKMLADAAKEESRALILGAKAKRDLGKLLDAVEVCDRVTEVVSECVARLRSVASNVGALAWAAGPKEAEKIIGRAVDEALAQLSEIEWLKDEAKKKLLAGNFSSTPSVESFDLLPRTDHSHGFAETSSSSPPTPAPETSESKTIQPPPCLSPS